MKQGKTLNQLAQELTRIQETAKDYTVPVSKMRMNEHAQIEFKNGDLQKLDLNDWSANQLANYTEIPRAYFDRIRGESTSLLANNVNHAFGRITAISESERKPESRMVRTLDGKVRAFLSSRYRRLDSYDLLNETLPVLIDGKFQIVSSEITDRRLYLKATTEQVQGEVKKGDVMAEWDPYSNPWFNTA